MSANIFITNKSALVAEHFKISQTKAERLISRYLEVISDELLRRITSTKQTYNETYTYSIEGIRLPFGDFISGGTRYYFKDLNALLKQVNTLKKGNNMEGTLSEGYIGEAALQALADKDPQRVFDLLYKDVEATNGIDCVPVKTDCLKDYIDDCKARLANKDQTKSTSYYNKIKRNMHLANAIAAVAEVTGGTIPQVVSYSKFGPKARRYYRGLNLQTVSKEVRHAALGKCYLIDFRVAAMSIMLEIVRHILITEHNCNNSDLEEMQKEFSYTSDYIQNRTIQRVQIAKETFVKDGAWLINQDFAVSLIKEAMAAIGFGAGDVRGCWMQGDQFKTGALKEIIKNPEAYNRFINSDIVSNILKEQKRIKDIIIKSEYAKSVADVIGNDATKMAAIYQIAERQYIDIVVDLLKKDNVNVILQVHDALYIDKKYGVADINFILKEDHNVHYLQFDKVEEVGYTSTAVLAMREEEEFAHRQHIAREEREAKMLFAGRQSEFQQEVYVPELEEKTRNKELDELLQEYVDWQEQAGL